ncbi:hypothetical protein DL98DRAFT_512774 [Cadophora sp. DSE1049]|nr:hypothetical protein DL98DRAFT_512774 [Cadophora sp. DSE1049]
MLYHDIRAAPLSRPKSSPSLSSSGYEPFSSYPDKPFPSHPSMKLTLPNPQTQGTEPSSFHPAIPSQSRLNSPNPNPRNKTRGPEGPTTVSLNPKQRHRITYLHLPLFPGDLPCRKKER